MPKGIAIFGANGCGKTTIGRELATRLGIPHLDAEDYYFEETEIPYAKPRPKDAVIELMLSEIEKTDFFAVSGVTCDFGDQIRSMIQLGVWLSAPREIRWNRVEHRSLEKFGDRVLPGGDMAKQEKEFLEYVKKRNLAVIEEWAKTLSCPILRLDGTKPISENAAVIVEKFRRIQ